MYYAYIILAPRSSLLTDLMDSGAGVWGPGLKQDSGKKQALGILYHTLYIIYSILCYTILYYTIRLYYTIPH